MATVSCKKDEQELPTFYEQAAGVWAPYEIVYADGRVDSGSFAAASVFGVYAESVQLNKDKTFFPAFWFSEDNFGIKTNEGGSFEYFPNDKRLTFDGIWELEFFVTKFNGDDMWLKSGEVLWKYNRKQ